MLPRFSRCAFTHARSALGIFISRLHVHRQWAPIWKVIDKIYSSIISITIDCLIITHIEYFQFIGDKEKVYAVHHIDLWVSKNLQYIHCMYSTVESSSSVPRRVLSEFLKWVLGPNFSTYSLPRVLNISTAPTCATDTCTVCVHSKTQFSQSLRKITFQTTVKSLFGTELLNLAVLRIKLAKM